MTRILAILVVLAGTASPSTAQTMRFSDMSDRIATSVFGWHGVSIADVDGDGWDDIFFAGWTATQLWHNNHNLTFTDITTQAGVTIPNGGSYVGLFADVNNDGAPDLFVGGSGGLNKLFRNNGNGTFTDVTATSGIDPSLAIATAAFGDVDNDGRIDLVCATPGSDVLYRNVSSGNVIAFQDVSSTAAVGGDTGTIPMQVTFIDDLHTGRSSLFFVHDGFDKSTLFRNTGAFPFVDAAPAAGIASVGRGNSMGVVWFDYNNDGWEDAYITRIDSAGLYRNNGNGTFLDQAGVAGCDSNGMSWGVVADDFDNDGDEDLYITNTSGYGGKHPFTLLYENLGGSFKEIGASARVATFMDGKGAASGDFNNDGYRDIVVADLATGKNKLFINAASTSKHWLEIDLRGTTVNRMAIGTRVRVVAGGKSQVRTVTAGSSFASQVSPTLHVGLGSATQVDTIEIFWAPNAVQRMTGIAVDQRLTIVQTVTAVREQDRADLPTGIRVSAFPNPFNPSTTVRLDLAERDHVRLTLVDMLGRTVSTLLDDQLTPGVHQLTLNGSGLASGFYILHAQASNHRSATPLLLLR